MLTVDETYRLTLQILAVGITVGALEYWTEARAFAHDGVFSWEVLRLRPDVPSRLADIFAALPDVAVIRALMALRLAGLALALSAGPATPAFSTGLALLVGTDATLWWRRTAFGADGSDQMTTIILVTTFLCAGPIATPTTMVMGLLFIAAQSALSYFASGTAKLASPVWRSGAAVGMIFGTASYGTPTVARLVRAHPQLSFVLSWSAMVAETLFPLCLVVATPWRWLFLAWGVAFHGCCAAVMGLNNFLWAFVATYPALLFAAVWVEALLSR